MYFCLWQVSQAWTNLRNSTLIRGMYETECPAWGRHETLLTDLGSHRNSQQAPIFSCIAELHTYTLAQWRPYHCFLVATPLSLSSTYYLHALLSPTIGSPTKQGYISYSSILIPQLFLTKHQHLILISRFVHYLEIKTQKFVIKFCWILFVIPCCDNC